jgi:hypothetical protein
VKRRLFYLGDIGGVPQLISTNIDTGTTTVHAIPNSGTYLFFEYDLVAGRLLAATTASGIPIVAIDPDTGSVQTLMFAAFAGGLRFEVSAYDAVHRRLFFLGDLGGVPQLITADLATDSAIARPIPTSGTYLFFEYDRLADRIIAATTAAGRPVVSIDPSSGAVLPLVNTGFSGAVRFEVSTLDVLGRRLYFLGDIGGVPQLVTVALGTGSTQVQPIPTEGTYLFVEFAPAPSAIPMLSPLSLGILAVCFATIATTCLARAA